MGNFMDFEKKDNELVLHYNGRLDASNAEAYEKEMLGYLEETNGLPVVVDADNLEYISSAGLRIILRAKKKFGDFSIINVRPEVYEVFEMTGFSEMMSITKAFRKLSVDGCPIIGRGSNGIVYRYDDETIIKVYMNPDSLDDIKKEKELAKKALVLGIPTAIPFDVVRVGNSYGSVFELLNAQSFAGIIAEDESKLEEVIDEYIAILKQFHSTEILTNDMPSVKKTVLKWASDIQDKILPEDYEKLVKLINEVPERNTLIHGDYHLKNLMVQNGESLIIDMDTLSVGHPIFELGTIYLAFEGFSIVNHQQSMEFMGLPYETSCKIWKMTIQKYLGSDNQDELNAFEEKAKLIGFVRMYRRTLRRTPDDKALLDICSKNLHELINKVDTLLF